MTRSIPIRAPETEVAHSSAKRPFRSAKAGVAAVCLLLAACSPGSGLPPLQATPAGPYRLGVGEDVRIITFGEERLTGQFRVNDRGDIAIPLLGTIPANGLTTTELEQSIAKQLTVKKVLLNPSVSVEVLQYRPVFILGEVSKPGEYPYQPGMTVLTAVAIAGGFSYRAETGYASILRTSDGHSVEGRVPRGMEVRPGDVIDIFERYF
ncbi:polysaccharide biosynthesis/export family protein [Acidisphaera sp. S103]|uniref:polysaccharide biosynthesis/export family protein n=1 Tax=Acidisphaera sp. S103 TaxID=1747223 RepID=UPI00131D1CB2|nr:polysaccharide biosynthesis/export family protein [Acidisphaera sp. S103]